MLFYNSINIGWGVCDARATGNRREHQARHAMKQSRHLEKTAALLLSAAIAVSGCRAKTGSIARSRLPAGGKRSSGFHGFQRILPTVPFI
jgi:hypothetical protein